MILFDSIWPDIGEKVDLVRFLWKGEVFWNPQDVLECGLVGFIVQEPLEDIQCQTSFIDYIRFTNEYLVDNISNQPEPTCLYTNKWFQAPQLHNTNNSIQHQQFVCT